MGGLEFFNPTCTAITNHKQSTGFYSAFFKNLNHDDQLNHQSVYRSKIYRLNQERQKQERSIVYEESDKNVRNQF
ncbi:hypothetical protein GJ496_010826 [Pomphorhynchus laevis]|nr:hypothetical protein GJ496_010826 [Pomphorhynchus laevis]